MLNDKLLNPNNDLHLDSTSTFPEANVINCPHSLLSIGYPCDGIDSWVIVLAEVFDDFGFFLVLAMTAIVFSLYASKLNFTNYQLGCSQGCEGRFFYG